MVLANDNLWGYTSDLIYRFKVTWLEAAIVQPCWTTMMVCYVEGDHGHLMGEELLQQQFRTRVRGTAHSFHMPWADIIEELQRNCISAGVASCLPRDPSCLKYVLKVHLRVATKLMDKVLRQLTVRPFVLLHLLYFLIDQNHEVFRGKGTAQKLKQDMQQAVRRLYPVDPASSDRPEEEQTWTIPSDLVCVDDSSQQDKKRKTAHYVKEKNATPGEGGQMAESFLANTRPSAVNPGQSAASHSDPASMRTGAVMDHGKLTVQTEQKPMGQWHPKYFAQILPFVIPHMVSGPDFSFYEKDLRWRRQQVTELGEAPWVAPWKWLAGFARRCEAQCRQAWDALPIMRSVIWKYVVETGGTKCAVPFKGAAGEVTEFKAKDWIRMAQKLCDTLWKGHVRYGNVKVPLNGDTTRLSQAEGLTKREKAMARQIAYKAQHMPGTQALRQVMGHDHWGARVTYGDCLFFTISPNEKQSAWVLKLSRYRKNDPFIRHAEAPWQRLCGVEYPSIAAKRRRRKQGR